MFKKKSKMSIIELSQLGQDLLILVISNVFKQNLIISISSSYMKLVI